MSIRPPYGYRFLTKEELKGNRVPDSALILTNAGWKETRWRGQLLPRTHWNYSFCATLFAPVESEPEYCI